MHSGLFTLRFFPVISKEEPAVDKSTDKSKVNDWHVLLRISVDNEVFCVRRKGKIFAESESSCASGSSGEPIPGLERVAHKLTNRDATVFMRCHCQWQQTDSFRFDVHFDRLEGSVVGVKEEFLDNVTVSCEGSLVCGWYMGETTVTVGGKPLTGEAKVSVGDKPLALPRRLRFVLELYHGPLCTNCLEPVYERDFTCAECGVVEYCSRECQAAHMSGGHGLLCPLLERTYSVRSGRVLTETEKGADLVAWWRSLEDASFSILLDYRNPIGQSVEFFISTLKPAQDEGLRYRYIVRDGVIPREVPQEELVDLACTVFRAVSENAIIEGCTSLAAACLNYIFVYSRHIKNIWGSHVLYYYSYLCEDFEGPICSVEEYVTYARPLHEFGVALIEYALKSPTALLFWHRIKFAKNVLINLYNVNQSCQCSEIKELVDTIPEHQRETLYLLSKLYLIMASRAPKKDTHRLLGEAEKFLRDCLPTEQELVHENANCMNDKLIDDDTEEMEPSYLATLYYRLSSLLLLYGNEEKTREAGLLKAQGDALIRKAKAAEVKA